MNCAHGVRLTTSETAAAAHNHVARDRGDVTLRNMARIRAPQAGRAMAHGVTTVRDMGGDHEELLQWRRDIRGDRRIGPRLLHDEMALFVNELGMTPGEALDRATRRSAAFLGVGDSSGTVERGKIADLVILDADPLRDISNTRRIAGVVLRGRPFDQRAIEDLKTSVRNALDRKVDDWGRTSPLRRPK